MSPKTRSIASIMLRMKSWCTSMLVSEASQRITSPRSGRLLTRQPPMNDLEAMDLRSIQKPLKEKYRSDPNSSRISLKAHSTESDIPVACSVEVDQKLFK